MIHDRKPRLRQRRALGTDTGGSVRLPAAYTGIVGFKPSYGLISRWGVAAYANSLDTVGILAHTSKTVRDIYGKRADFLGRNDILRNLADIVKGHDPRDPTSIDLPRSSIRQYVSEFGEKSGMRIGVPLEYNISELQPVIKSVWINTIENLQRMGHSVLPVNLPATRNALSAYYVIAPAEASSNLARYDGVRYGRSATTSDKNQGQIYSGTRGAGLGEEVRRRILLGSYSLSAAAFDNYFIQAQKVRRLVQQDFNRAFRHPHPLLKDDQQVNPKGDDGVDIIICPTVPSLPPKLKDIIAKSPVSAYSADAFTVPASLAGLPAMNVPVRLTKQKNWDAKDIPSVGIQIIGQYGCEDAVFAAASAIEDLDA